MKYQFLSRWRLQIVATLILAIFCATTLVQIHPVQAQERMLKTLTVTGQGREIIPTTLTQVSLGVEVRAKTAAEAQQQVANKTESVVKFLQSQQVEKLQTTGIRLQPNYNYSNNQRRLDGYIGVNNVRFRLETGEAGKVMDQAVTAGATRIDGISFTATDSAIAVAQKQALKFATTDAQEQADAVLGSLNLRRKDIVSIQVNGASAPIPQPRAFAEAASIRASGDSTTPVVGGEQTIQANVTLQINY